jgi:hypothetical protein
MEKRFISSKNVQTGFGGYPVSYSVGAGLFTGGGGGVNRPGCEADHLPPSSAEVKNERSYTFTAVMYLDGLHKDKTYLSITEL